MYSFHGFSPPDDILAAVEGGSATSFCLFTHQNVKSPGQVRELNEALYKKTWDQVLKERDHPRFIYMHLEIPHYPYYFDRNGKPNALKDLYDTEQGDLKKYIEYLQYGNKRYLELIDHIFTHSKKPPVIMFMSDHGFRKFVNDSVDHRYHFMNINSVYLPGKQYQGFYKGMSNVNQFRVLLNTQFQQHLPILKDSSIFLRD